MAGFRLGSVLGFRIRVDFSWFIIFFLILWSFTVAVFPQALPGLDRVSYFIMGFSGALLFFVSLLLHELSHSVVARAKGIPVEGITLFVFGGIAHTSKEAETPGDEFLIAVVGPLMSFALAGAFSALAWVFAQQEWSHAANVVFGYLAALNLLLAVFNLLPGFPLDGGRLFRSAVWRFTGNLTKATRVASIAGQGLGYALVGFGLFFAFTGDVFSGLWLVLIGWFLRNAAAASFRQHLVRDVLDETTARQTMTPVPVTVTADVTLGQLMENFFMQRRFMSYPVLDEDGRAIGVITMHQVNDVPRDQWLTRTVRETMTPASPEIVVDPDDPLSEVLAKLRASPVRRVLVTRNGALEGIITARDVASWLEKMRTMGRSPTAPFGGAR